MADVVNFQNSVLVKSNQECGSQWFECPRLQMLAIVLHMDNRHPVTNKNKQSNLVRTLL